MKPNPAFAQRFNSIGARDEVRQIFSLITDKDILCQFRGAFQSGNIKAMKAKVRKTLAQWIFVMREPDNVVDALLDRHGQKH